MSEYEIRLYSAIRTRIDPAVELNVRKITTLYRFAQDEIVVGYQGSYAMTLTGLEVWGA